MNVTRAVPASRSSDATFTCWLQHCLGLELDDAGFDFSVLSEFRDRMAEGDRADRLLAVMVDHLVAAELVTRRGGRVRTDSTHVLAAVRTLNRAELVAETLRAALEQLALADEEWLAPLVLPGWADRYGRPAFYHRLPKGKPTLEEYVLQVGEDGIWLLRAVFGDGAPPRLRTLPQVEILRRVWVQQYWYDAKDRLRWRGPKSTKDRLSRRSMPRRADLPPLTDGRPDPAMACVPCASVEIVSPHDAQARYSRKLTAAGTKNWIGYRDHQSELCNERCHWNERARKDPSMARQDVKDEVLYLRAAGLDLGKKFLLAWVRTPCAKRPGTWTLETDGSRRPEPRSGG